MTAAAPETIEVRIEGMDCANCVRSVQGAIASVPGVVSADVLLSAEKAIVRIDSTTTSVDQIHEAVERAGYRINLPPPNGIPNPGVIADEEVKGFTRSILLLLGAVFVAILVIVVAGEWLGLLENITERVPLWAGTLLVLAFGYPIFRNVVRSTLRGQVISHTLMTVGVLAALAVGQWATAVVVVFFMRIGDYAEHFTAERGRKAVRDLTALAPKTARVERDGVDIDVPIAEVQVGQVVVVRPGEAIPVDGEVIAGQATVNQAAITGESVPVEAFPATHVFAASIAQLGSLRIRTTGVGADTTFGRVIKLVEEAESNRADVQRIADRFSAWFLPLVAGVAIVTYALSRDPIATAAVLVVACSCSLALATPIAMLASIGAAAKRGILIKGGKYVETLAKADVLLIDKTGTLTIGAPRITDVITLNGLNEDDIVSLAASAERDSEHPLAAAVRSLAVDRQLRVANPEWFAAVPGQGIRAGIDGHTITIGNPRLVSAEGASNALATLEAQGKTTLLVGRDEETIAVLAASDQLRPEVPAALSQLRALGVKRIEILTGDSERVAAALASPLGLDYRAGLLPEDKIAIVKAYQAQGHTVVMVGDGVNDAPALAQANVGIAMGAAGSDVAIEAAHIALMRDDWSLVPEVFQIARRTMGTVKTNIGFTAAYNVVGISLAAFGFFPPMLAAAAQSLPDLGIMANSSRLLRYRPSWDKAGLAPDR